MTVPTVIIPLTVTGGRRETHPGPSRKLVLPEVKLITTIAITREGERRERRWRRSRNFIRNHITNWSLFLCFSCGEGKTLGLGNLCKTEAVLECKLMRGCSGAGDGRRLSN